MTYTPYRKTHRKHWQLSPERRTFENWRHGAEAKALRFKLYEEDYHCPLCGIAMIIPNSLTTRDGTNSIFFTSFDHIIPLTQGGSNDPSNLRLICKGCNDLKGKFEDPTNERVKRLQKKLDYELI